TDNADPAPIAKAYLTHLIDGIVINVRNGDVLVPVNLLPGMWRLTIEATDWAGNSSFVTTPSFEIIYDVLPPRTVLEIGEPKYTTETKIYLSFVTPIRLSAIDDLIEVNDNQGMGVKSIHWKTNIQPEWTVSTNVEPVSGQIFKTESFNLKNYSDGLYDLLYFAKDIVENTEEVKTTVIAVDNTSPVTEISISEPKFDAFGTQYVSPKTPITLKAFDPVINNSASGIKFTEYRIDSGSFTVYNSSFSISVEGKHTIEFRSIDNAGNREQTKTYTVFVTAIFDYALIGLDEVKINGQAQVAGNVLSNNEMEINGHVNVYGNVYAKEVDLNGQSIIHENVYFETIKIDAQSKVIGQLIKETVTVSTYPINLEQITRYVINNNDNNKLPLTEKGKSVLDKDLKFKIDDKDKIILSTGVYYFNEIKINGESHVIINGNVDILCQGKVKVDGKSGFNTEGASYNLVIFVDREKDEESDKKDKEEIEAGEIKINGESRIQSVIYAPYSKIEINGKSKAGGHYFGVEASLNGQSILEVPCKLVPVSIKPKNEEEQKEETTVPEIKIYENEDSVNVEAFTFNEVEITVYDTQDNKIDFARFSAPQNIKGIFDYTYRVKDGIENKYLCEIKVFGIWRKLIKTKRIEKCSQVRVKFVK
ncbi:MAG: polymer-forming cytoskeletal protein, partial [Elusimicrobia bacterium]|nr:polymer-forming cytoskeletal protein [Elusimicrobiota bacterium]